MTTSDPGDPSPSSAPGVPATTGGGRRTAFAIGAVLVVAVALGGALAVARPWQPSAPTCQATAAHPEWSVARQWDEALLDAIRRALPNPPVHARNLFHTSVAMYDAWAAYDSTATGYVVTEKAKATDIQPAREEAMSYAAYRVLSHRFEKSVGGTDSLIEFNELMASRCYDIDVTGTTGDTPAALGNRIGAAVLAYGLADGSNEATGYDSPGYKPVNPPLIVAAPGTVMTDPNRWQPLQIEHMVSQNGIPVTNGVQKAVGPHWGQVRSFALPDGGAAHLPIDPGPPPRLGDSTSDQAFKDDAVTVLRDASRLDPAQGISIDISPGTIGNDPLGTNDGTGYAANPVTGQPYAADVVNQGDWARALAEFWADGPKSETPPGHWNVIANTVSDTLAPNLEIGGAGPTVDRLEWDTKLYFALNGATSDAAIEAWGLKGTYDSSRPISQIRYMAQLGQSSDPSGPSYDPEGLPLVPGLIDVITRETTAPGERHAALKGHEGEIAVLSWAGKPADPKTQTGGVTWIRGVDWRPYQADTFVTPAFSGYASGHSTFSRSAAEVMAGFTGSEFFPGGLGEYTVKQGDLKFEYGPTQDLTFQWATYFDAADQAGLSRLYGGIHPPADDFTGRRMGSQVGKAAWEKAQTFFAGTAAAAN